MHRAPSGRSFCRPARPRAPAVPPGPSGRSFAPGPSRPHLPPLPVAGVVRIFYPIKILKGLEVTALRAIGCRSAADLPLLRLIGGVGQHKREGPALRAV